MAIRLRQRAQKEHRVSFVAQGTETGPWSSLHAGLAILFIAAFAGTRQQGLIGDRQFVASMVPHHSGAILMCREAELKDPELVKLCGQIPSSQRKEIDEMNAIQKRLSAM
ncbi:DUF305 domain-containing protein [Variovorax paradoxus]|uniref:DUF305 domain-containing protein n=1 Tax=Variovorax paradoxus TaxID=34073 RepID=A0A0H2LR49_VARPD|nr:hypothetical protein VPARA_67160 [Variovorax paradoxus]